jgi:hypothetical protein
MCTSVSVPRFFGRGAEVARDQINIIALHPHTFASFRIHQVTHPDSKRLEKASDGHLQNANFGNVDKDIVILPDADIADYLDRQGNSLV